MESIHHGFQNGDVVRVEKPAAGLQWWEWSDTMAEYEGQTGTVTTHRSTAHTVCVLFTVPGLAGRFVWFTPRCVVLAPSVPEPDGDALQRIRS